MRTLLVAVALLAAPPPALAGPSRSHRHQVGIATTLGSGYRIIFPYGDAAFCAPGRLRPNVCDGRVPTWLDVKLFFGVTHAVDLVLEQRFGLERDFHGNHQFILMPGIRVYPGDAHGAFKFYVQFQFVFDYSDPWGAWQRYDIGLHEANGFQWDFSRYFGAYIQISETFMFLRSFGFSIEGGAGIEARFP